MEYTIYQIKDVRNTIYAFRGWCDVVATNFNIDDYAIAYIGEMVTPDNIVPENFLDVLFEKFNINRPDDFAGHSLSVSDMIVLNNHGKAIWYYCDSFGWENITEFVLNRIKE